MTQTKEIGKLKVYYRLRCSMRHNALAQHVSYVATNKDNMQQTIIKQHINLFLPRMWRAYDRQKYNNERYDWDYLFSHTVSHEYIHKCITKIDGPKASAGFDKLKGQYDLFEYNYIRTGLPLKEER